MLLVPKADDRGDAHRDESDRHLVLLWQFARRISRAAAESTTETHHEDVLSFTVL
jgi:hypothetical protein